MRMPMSHLALHTFCLLLLVLSFTLSDARVYESVRALGQSSKKRKLVTVEFVVFFLTLGPRDHLLFEFFCYFCFEDLRAERSLQGGINIETERLLEELCFLGMIHGETHCQHCECSECSVHHQFA